MVFGKSHTVVYCDCVHINNTTVEFYCFYLPLEKKTQMIKRAKKAGKKNESKKES